MHILCRWSEYFRTGAHMDCISDYVDDSLPSWHRAQSMELCVFLGYINIIYIG